MHFRTLLLAAVSATTLAATGAAAQTSPAPGSAPEATEVEGVVVTALPLGRAEAEVAQAVDVLAGQELVHRRQSTLGETLTSLPGVNSETFGGGSSRPVIRGQTSPRVRVLSDGAALLDASEVSPDHAVSTEPLLLRGIEILRGPSALLYGGGAIGGAVNLLDERVPTRQPTDGIDGAGEVRVGTADDEIAGVAGATIGAGGFALRLEAAARDTSDYEVPDWEEDTLPGTSNRTSTGTVGLSWIGSRGYVGAAFTEHRSEYGLPGHGHEYEDCHPHGSSLHCGGHDDEEEDHEHDDEHEDEERPVIDLRSRRIDVRGELRDLGPLVERVRFRGGFTDYEHDEVEEGEVATTFTNDGYDARVEVQHTPVGGFRGVVGAQLSRTSFAALGDEAFLPESRTRNSALFVLEEYDIGAVRLEGALRHEWQEAEAVGRPDASHRPLSISGAAVWSAVPGFTVALSLSRSQRAPTAQELYADGVHLATNTFEIGTATLGVETSNAVELTLRKTEGPTTFSVSGYRYAYDGYIFARTLDRFEDFRLIRYDQADATFTGLEGELRHDFTPGFAGELFGDLVRAELDSGGNLPRIPAARLGARGEFEGDGWNAEVEFYRAFEQEDVADFETVTPGYNMLNVTLAYDFDLAGNGAQVFLRGTNLLDELALNHASFLTNVAPLRGRNLVLGVRASF